MPILPLAAMGGSLLGLLALLYVIAGGPSPARAQARRLAGVRERHGTVEAAATERMRRVATSRGTRMDLAVGKLLPNPENLRRRLAMTGKTWTVSQYGMTSGGLLVIVTVLLRVEHLPFLLALLAGVALGGGLPHWWVGRTIKRRVARFTVKFPDAIELLVRGLRSGLPISETMAVVGHEVDGPVGEEFRSVVDKMKIGKSMDAALQDTADRLGTPEFQFFVITIAIQRETGGNLAETLANLAHVLRQRSQMKLKIKAMSSESKASAYIVGSLPFIVFTLIWFINASYMQNFFVDQRLMIAGLGGLVWMGIGAGIMAKMVNFEI
ncbi:type II secretion system F family protein [Sphingomonas bacterium]|uniref:type II secretion system F family protein n=1 Tax=Sphingomonas bacterium TaxID=1895847 RepID=UPI0015772E7D|nr:type II secretion system F family protein [Sphingomonas bacterium]